MMPRTSARLVGLPPRSSNATPTVPLFGLDAVLGEIADGIARIEHRLGETGDRPRTEPTLVDRSTLARALSISLPSTRMVLYLKSYSAISSFRIAPAVRVASFSPIYIVALACNTAGILPWLDHGAGRSDEIRWRV